MWDSIKAKCKQIKMLSAPWINSDARAFLINIPLTTVWVAINFWAPESPRVVQVKLCPSFIVSISCLLFFVLCYPNPNGVVLFQSLVFLTTQLSIVPLSWFLVEDYSQTNVACNQLKIWQFDLVTDHNCPLQLSSFLHTVPWDCHLFPVFVKGLKSTFCIISSSAAKSFTL